MIQVLVNSITEAALSALVALAFSLLYRTGGFFNFILGGCIAGGSYAMFWLSSEVGAPLVLAIVAGAIIAGGLGAIGWLGIARRLLRLETPSWALLVATLALYTLCENAISLTFGDTTRTVRKGSVEVGYEVLDAHVTGAQLVIVIVSAGVFLLVAAFLARGRMGRMIRAVASNSTLCPVYGIDVERAMLWATVIGCALAGLTGELSALDTDMDPTIGFRLLMGGVIVSIIAGTGGYRYLIGAAIILGLTRNLVGFYIDTKWTEATMFAALIGFVALRPRGLSGRRLRKVDI